MSHLKENNISYFRHLYRAWRWGIILFVHGIFPEVFKTTVSDEICSKRLFDKDELVKEVKDLKKSCYTASNLSYTIDRIKP